MVVCLGWTGDWREKEESEDLNVRVLARKDDHSADNSSIAA